MRRREQRRLGFDIVKLDSLSACKLVSALLTIGHRHRDRHVLAALSAETLASISDRGAEIIIVFLKPCGRGVYLWRERGVWIFAFPRRKQRGPTDEQLARDFDIFRLDDPARAEAAAQRLAGSDANAVIEMCLTRFHRLRGRGAMDGEDCDFASLSRSCRSASLRSARSARQLVVRVSAREREPAI